MGGGGGTDSLLICGFFFFVLSIFSLVFCGTIFLYPLTRPQTTLKTHFKLFEPQTKQLKIKY